MEHCTSQHYQPIAGTFTIALAGNPNAGKSTIFNALTGARQHVANWPGKTVEKKSGILKLPDQDIAVVDLPGTYSLTAYSVEEIIARNFIVEDHPNAVVAVVDAGNIERNLYLVLQLLEMNVPLLVVLNMMDVAERRHIQIDAQQLGERLGVPIIYTIGSREIGLDELKDNVRQLSQASSKDRPFPLRFGDVLETEIEHLQHLIEEIPSLKAYPARWLAIKLLENDNGVLVKIATDDGLKNALNISIGRILEHYGEDPEIVIADARYGVIADISSAVIRRPTQSGITTSEKIDRVLTHRIAGIPIFFLFMWIVFQLTAHASSPFVDWLDSVISGPVSRWVQVAITTLGLGNTWVEALLLDGIISSVGSVLVFVPVLFFLYFAIAILEDSGYMARAAFVMDRFMSLIGLHGKSFLPMLVGFGCTVPAIYATRTLDNEQDRKVTAFLTTFMSCGARLPVYVIFGAAFFGSAAGNLIFGMYLLGIGIAVLTSLILTKIVYRAKPAAPFVMELPPYRMPNMTTVLRNMWQRTVSFVQKAGSVILVASISIWLLLSIPMGSNDGKFADVKPQDSVYGTLSEILVPVFAPAGFGEWQASGSLISGLVAKEVIVSSMTQVYVGTNQTQLPEETILIDDVKQIVVGFGEASILTLQEIINIGPRTVNLLPGIDIQELNIFGQTDDEVDTSVLETALGNHFSALSAVAFTAFVLLYVPCMTTIGAMRHEFGAKWMLLQMSYTLGIAWLVAILIFQGGTLMGWGG